MKLNNVTKRIIENDIKQTELLPLLIAAPGCGLNTIIKNIVHDNGSEYIRCSLNPVLLSDEYLNMETITDTPYFREAIRRGELQKETNPNSHDVVLFIDELDLTDPRSSKLLHMLSELKIERIYFDKNGQLKPLPRYLRIIVSGYITNEPLNLGSVLLSKLIVRNIEPDPMYFLNENDFHIIVADVLKSHPEYIYKSLPVYYGNISYFDDMTSRCHNDFTDKTKQRCTPRNLKGLGYDLRLCEFLDSLNDENIIFEFIEGYIGATDTGLAVEESLLLYRAGVGPYAANDDETEDEEKGGDD